MTDPTNAERLVIIAASIRQWDTETGEWRRTAERERNALIRLVRQEGASLREIAALAGLSFERVRQIVATTPLT